jgi:hypothetical protein
MELKIQITVLFLVFFTSVYSQQSYLSMLDTSSTWIDVVGCVEPPNDFYESYYYYSISGDTLIDDYLYYKFIQSNQYEDENILFGYIFENDSGQVYFRISEDFNLDYFCYFGSEIGLLTDTNLLFIDFSAQVGDILNLPFSENDLFVFYTGEVEIGGVIRKEIQFMDDFLIYGSWIEGIGGVIGGFFGSWCGQGIGCVPDLFCSTANGEEVYGNCNVGIFEQGLQELEFKILPNPASDLIKITFNSNSNENFEAAIFDVKGIMVLNSIINKSSNQINIDKLDSGIYLLRLISDNGYYKASRFIVIK